MGGQYHFHLETQTALIIPGENNEIKAHIATQLTTNVQATIASVVGVPISNVEVQVKRCGGGYGGKLLNSESLSSALAVAALKLGFPVRAVMDLDTNMTMLGRRPVSLANYTVGVSSSGKIIALEVAVYTDGGCQPNDAQLIPLLIIQTLDSCYYIPNFNATCQLVRTNTPAHTSARGPGWTPGIFFMEHIMEHVSSVLEMDPLALKELNFFQKGQTTPDGTPLKYWNLDTIWSQLQETSSYAQRLQEVESFNAANMWKKKGLSIVPCRWAGNWANDHHSALVAIYADGSVLVSISGVEIGQGINTKVAQAVAYTLKIPIELISILNHNTTATPNVGPTGGSVTSSLCCKAASLACETLNSRLAPLRNFMKAQFAETKTWKELIAAALKAGVVLQAQGDCQPGPGPLSPTVAYNSYSAVVQEVMVDILTGEIQLTRTDILFDAGYSLNPAVDIGQVEGGYVMGLGLYLTEELLYNSVGQLTTTNTWEYKPLTALDGILDFRVALLANAPNPLDYLSSKLTGEPPLALSCAAVFAIQHAIRSFKKDTNQQFKDLALNSPVTVDVAQLACNVNPSLFTF
eukprot:TRINITY_DN6432_c0_g2_i5.p1 TRINITY_DN6432_c0_g2~~TRINITY_DN6432_c0_g2_i5.p1  ORF type:complete len:577 (-),score=132.37 TRINITY_DN6432_c0_g2_i5:70-1800(-)